MRIGPMHFHTSICISQQDKKGRITMPLHDLRLGSSFLQKNRFNIYKAKSKRRKQTPGGMDVQGIDVKIVSVVRAIEAPPVVTVLSLLASSSTNKPGYRRQSAVGAGTGRVCTLFRTWVPRGLYFVWTTTTQSGTMRVNQGWVLNVWLQWCWPTINLQLAYRLRTVKHHIAIHCCNPLQPTATVATHCNTLLKHTATQSKPQKHRDRVRFHCYFSLSSHTHAHTQSLLIPSLPFPFPLFLFLLHSFSLAFAFTFFRALKGEKIQIMAKGKKSELRWGLRGL